MLPGLLHRGLRPSINTRRWLPETPETLKRSYDVAIIGGGGHGLAIAYYLAVPLLRAYQKRRKGAIKAKFDLLKKKASAKAEAKRKAEQAALEGKDHGGTR